jgi:hypothetical protein
MNDERKQQATSSCSGDSSSGSSGSSGSIPSGGGVIIISSSRRRKVTAWHSSSSGGGGGGGRSNIAARCTDTHDHPQEEQAGRQCACPRPYGPPVESRLVEYGAPAVVRAVQGAVANLHQPLCQLVVAAFGGLFVARISSTGAARCDRSRHSQGDEHCFATPRHSFRLGPNSKPASNQRAVRCPQAWC